MSAGSVFARRTLSRREKMSFKKTLGRLVALLIIGGALIFGMSGIFHEAPWIVAPLFGSAKIEFAGKHLDSDTRRLSSPIFFANLHVFAVIAK